MSSHSTLIPVASLQAELSDVFLADCSHDLAAPAAGEQAYAEAHIPGAVHFHLDRDLSARPSGRNGRHPLPTREALAATLAARGLRDGQQVVAYDGSQGVYAARLWWLLRWLGHPHVAVLDGGLQAWTAAGGATEAGAARPRPAGDFRARPSLVEHVDVDAVLANVHSGARLVVDARSSQRFAGVGETLDPIAGHIPGAVCRFFRDNLAENGCFKPAAALHAEWLTRLGGRAPSTVIHQCGSGVSACHNLLAMQHAGLSGSVLYPGSWSEWCSDTTRPVAMGPETVG